MSTIPDLEQLQWKHRTPEDRALAIADALQGREESSYFENNSHELYTDGDNDPSAVKVEGDGDDTRYTMNPLFRGKVGGDGDDMRYTMNPLFRGKVGVMVTTCDTP